ncbi:MULTISPECIES: Smr/MutS family protein [Acinetobacter]|jgi:DNA-nicking Smr family endonuclease|uniref:DNA mismatch repair protein MutS n=1 Tax=Acinetobacter chengduensis TaxID=2420890 RepID=A0ABX9TY84_9GAMM|nr:MULTISPECIES: Smr/MutS family protein [Acinetobacter]MBI1450698.1 Smr/MutS family protein [Acinetobacter sp. FL51]RKG40782.1 DNA mismatch repair protein MutS [Acinetobacter sp. WCHAc060007]RLL22838.1 DNA mismatch repair protein MutS [Acinetobacter chengduensis]
MSKHDSSLSKEQYNLLNAFKKQISKPAPVPEPIAPIEKTPEQEQQEDLDFFRKQMQGVQKIAASNIAKTAPSLKKKPDAQILAKRASATGPLETDETLLSDTQAMLNPVASQASLSYRIATLQHRVFEDLKAGNLRWFEAVDLHGCTIEEARSAVLQIIQMAKDNNENVLKIVHGKGPEAILKTHVNSWLRQHRDVLAFVSAPEKQGGTGAVLVLLKRAEKNPKFKQ